MNFKTLFLPMMIVGIMVCSLIKPQTIEAAETERQYPLIVSEEEYKASSEQDIVPAEQMYEYVVASEDANGNPVQYVKADMMNKARDWDQDSDSVVQVSSSVCDDGDSERIFVSYCSKSENNS